MSVENLTRYKLVRSPVGYSDFIQMCDKGECGEYIKFEEAMEASSNSLQQLKAEIAARLAEVDTFPRYNIPGPVSLFIEAMRQLSTI
jgi:hypothetical protein